MTNKGAIIAAMAARTFQRHGGPSLAASAADAAKVHCQGVNSVQGEERLFHRHQRLRRSEQLQGQGLDRDVREGLQGQGRHRRQVADGTVAKSSTARSPG